MREQDLINTLDRREQELINKIKVAGWSLGLLAVLAVVAAAVYIYVV